MQIPSTFLPRPTKINSFERLTKLTPPIPISCIVDIGVEEGTFELINFFPNHTHYLFEALPFHLPKIKENYKNILNEIFIVALSDQEMQCYLKVTAARLNNIPTSGFLTMEYTKPDNLFVLSCDKIQVRRFDSLPISDKLNNNFLLKLDTDGSEELILNGFGKTLNKASIIIIECTMPNIAQRINFLLNKGFILFDIVDICYYQNKWHQVDLIFLRNDLYLPDYQPNFNFFDINQWFQFQ